MAEPVLTLSDESIANLKVTAALGAAANAAAVVQALGPFMHDTNNRSGVERAVYTAALEVLRQQFIDRLQDAASK